MNNNNPAASTANTRSNVNTFTFARWFSDHKQASRDSIRALYQAPMANLLTMLILGVALALPVLLYLIILNASVVLNTWQQDFYQYSLYLENNVTTQQATVIKENLSRWPEVANINIISKEQGLAELKKALGIEKILDNLADLNNVEYNPLPIVLVVNLKREYRSIDNVKKLIAKSSNIAGVSKADADVALLEKLLKILNIFSYVVYIFSSVLGVAILLVISNTIRLMLENKQQEMILSSLLGATLSYIRRPYLYGGMFYGLFAGIVAYVVASFLFSRLYNIVASFSAGFSSGALINFNLSGFGIDEVFLLLVLSCLLGWLGARITLHFQTSRLQDRLVEI